MEDRDTLWNVLIAGAVFLAILFVAPKFFPARPLPPGPPQTGRPAASEEGNPARPPGAPGPASAPGARAGTEQAGGSEVTPAESGDRFTVVEAEAQVTRIMGSAQTHRGKTEPPSPYRMRLVLSNVGAAIESATMTDHARDVGSDERYTLLNPVERADGTIQRSLAIEKINVDGVDLRLWDKKWNGGPVIETQGGQAVEFSVDIHQEGKPALKITRTFRLPRQAKALGRHDLISTIRVQNRSASPHQVIVTYRGGVGVGRSPGSRMDDRYIDWGLFDPDEAGRVAVAGKRHRDVERNGGRLRLYTPSPATPHVRPSWAATANTYFTCTIAPLTHDGHDGPHYLSDVSAVDLDGSKLTEDDTTLRFVTRPQPLAPGGEVTYPADLYLGEKDGDAFRHVDDYARRNYYMQISQRFGWCTFSWLVELMIWLLNLLHRVTFDYGVAIIILVFIVRILLHPITKKGQVNMVRMQHRMQELAPKIEEVKKKYANDKVRMNQEMMKLNINPAGQLVTCLPMVIQMPIWVALYLSLSNNIQMRHEPLHFTWIHDMTAPDALYTFSSPVVIPLLGWHLPAFNLLPILLAIFMYLQQKLQPKPKPNPNMTDQQRQQQEMMKMMMPLMSVMMLIFFYKAPSGLNLYIMCSSLFGTIEQYRIRQHIKQQEEAGTLHQPVRKKERRLPAGGDKPRKPSFFERLQKMADEAHKTQAQGSAKRKVRR